MIRPINGKQPERTDIFYAEGNKGGDIVEITGIDDGLLRLKLAHCCVFSIDHIVPVEFITALLAKAVLDAGGVENAMKAVDWSDEYKDKLAAKIEEVKQ